MVLPLGSGVIGKGTLKLAAVVREYLLDTPLPETRFDQLREARRVVAVVAWYRDRQSEATGMVGGREHIATSTQHEQPDKMFFLISSGPISGGRSPTTTA